MPAPQIPLLRVSGTHARSAPRSARQPATRSARDVARPTGTTCPSGRTAAEQLALAAAYRDIDTARTAVAVRGARGLRRGEPASIPSRSCGLDRGDLVRAAHGRRAPIAGRCSDLVAARRRPPTATCSSAHNNDMSRRDQEDLVAIERACGDDPVVSSRSATASGSCVGWNDAGARLTGNELSPNDERVGIPRDIQVLRDAPRADAPRAWSTSRSAPIARRRTTTSSVDADGGVANVEGRATAAEVTGWTTRRAPRPHEPLRVRPDAALRGRPGVRGALGDPVARARALLAAAAARTVTMDTAPRAARGPRGRARLLVPARGTAARRRPRSGASPT